MLRVTRAWWTTTTDSGQDRTESLTHAFFKFEKWPWYENTIVTNILDFTNRIVIKTKESGQIVLCMQWRIAPSFKNLSHNTVRVLIN